MKVPRRPRDKRSLGKKLARWMPGGQKKQKEDVEHLRAGQMTGSDAQDLPALVLKGRCESRQDVVAHLEAGEAVPETTDEGFSGSLRALADSTVLRISREVAGRLAGRWSGRKLEDEPFRRDEPLGGGMVICWMPMTEGIPSGDLAGKVAETLFQETGQPVFRLQIKTKEASDTGERRGGEGIVIYGIANGRKEQVLPAVLQALARAREEFAYVLVEVGREVGAEVFREVLRRSQVVYPILRQNGESLFGVHLLNREIREQKRMAVALRPLVYLEAKEVAHGLSRYVEDSARCGVHFYLREAAGAGDRRLAATLRRLGRELCGHRVGLALSSGAARGLSHIGAIQVLEENGLEVDVVVGSSIGAYIAAIWGAGYDGRSMEQFARELEGYRGLWSLMDLSFFPRRGFLLTNRLRRRLEHTIGSRHFSDLERPIRVVATGLDSLESTVFSSGDVVEAVLASVAIPGVCVPVDVEGIPYVDGGICAPLPVDVLREMGIQKIIAVNTIATPEAIQICEMERAKNARPSWPGRVNSWINLFAKGNAFDTILRSIHAGQTRLAEMSCREADIVLRPYVCEGRWMDFGNSAQFIAMGREAAEEQLPALRALFASSHENTPTDKILAPVG